MKRHTPSAIALLLLGILISIPAWAAAGWTDYGSVGEFNQQGSITPGNEMLIIRVSVSANPSGCTELQASTCPS